MNAQNYHKCFQEIMIGMGQPIILQRNMDWISWLITDETICSNPAQPGDQTTYLRAPAPVVLDPHYCPKSRVSTNQKPHHLGCLRSPTWALPHPSYASGHLAGSGPEKVRRVVAGSGPQYDQVGESDHAHRHGAQ
jgi:hypothetical protein